MTQSTLFIADLHLSDQHEEIYTRFKKFLDNQARYARALYILGDLFEYYLGDDAISGVSKQVSEDIKNLVQQYNVQCFFMAGNRDFLVSEKFSQITILDDPTVLNFDDTKIIITHGDVLCTDDIDYQKLRILLRSAKWQQQFLAKSIAERIKFAQQARAQSHQYTQFATAEIMDVNQQAVDKLLTQYNSNILLHGHTHRPALHNYQQNGQNYHRMVLGDWHYQTSYIEYKNSTLQLITC
ncbi:MAG: UDP-2,3-diacylglucosamine diphosphatase [Proteobacteria bacterium]|nr:UDP-2,3-diacylglucosamine diphosphatase [Pseudomonadota bacterium]